jgi:hypothetical protein
MLIPHDYYANKVYGLPDRTIAVLIDHIAKSKGDNIVRLFTHLKSTFF